MDTVTSKLSKSLYKMKSFKVTAYPFALFYGSRFELNLDTNSDKMKMAHES